VGFEPYSRPNGNAGYTALPVFHTAFETAFLWALVLKMDENGGNWVALAEFGNCALSGEFTASFLLSASASQGEEASIFGPVW
jgi:hypothetical protein